MPVFTLSGIPGFTDLNNAVLAAGEPAYGIHVADISQNAAFGMVRLEFFQAFYKHGDQVILPTSTADGYNYSIEELIFHWSIAGTANQSTRWITGPDCLWYGNWKVEQTDPLNLGKVTCEEWYRRSGQHDNAAHSNDGLLLVTTIAQRERTNLTIAVPPTYQGDQSASIDTTDLPWKTGLATALNDGAKFAVINSEAMYMGEFVHGETVPQPVSPADGFTYQYSHCRFLPMWRWTTVGAQLTQPNKALGQLQALRMSVSNVGVVTLGVDYQAGDIVPEATATTHGRIGVIALCTRPF